MFNFKVLAVFTAAVMLLGTTTASAESDVKPSYANKKSGMVAFEPKKATQDEAPAAAEATDPSQIEPAAGVEDAAQDEKKENFLAEDMKLPRKN